MLRPGIFELIFVSAVLLACAGLGRTVLGARQRGEPVGPALGKALRAGAPAGRSFALSLGAAYAGVVEASKVVSGVPVVLHRDFRRDGDRVVTSGFVETRASIASP